MDEKMVDELLRGVAATAGLTVARRELIRAWRLSGVERLHLVDGSTMVFKYAAEPFTSEHIALRLAAEHGVPVPELRAATTQAHLLGMLLEDLGAPHRDADDIDGARAAVVLHAVPCLPKLPTLAQDHLAGLAEHSMDRVLTLVGSGRWAGVDDIVDMLRLLARRSESLVEGFYLAPFGLCHSEFHPTSLHIGDSGWRLLDFARAFNGPGLLDLASWHGTIDEPDPARLRELIEAYVAAGGPAEATTARAGLPAENWALGWHRIWALSWYLDQAVVWINDPSTDATYIAAVRRHLREAVGLLRL
ncbi:MAG: phosphotransferase [Dermatophilaceae bacterium]